MKNNVEILTNIKKTLLFGIFLKFGLVTKILLFEIGLLKI